MLKACVLFSNSAVKIYDSQAYRIMKMSRKRIGFTFDPRSMLLSPHNGDGCLESFAYAAIHMDCTCSLVVELFSGSN